MANASAPANSAKYLRIIDANLNRAREGLRVVEDTARFVLRSGRWYKRARAARHRLDTLTRPLYPVLLKQRDSRSDAGRTLPEGKRASLEAVLAANFRRVEESLRVLEEYSRLISPAAGPALKAMRFSIYILEKEFLAEDQPRHHP
ncbi:MAG: hypothetical protein ACYC5N_11035 [Endomicrobiales bacterium]